MLPSRPEPIWGLNTSDHFSEEQNKKEVKGLRLNF